MADNQIRTEATSQSPLRKALHISLLVLMYAFLVLSIFAVIVVLTSQKSRDGATNVFGHQMRIVVSESMEKCDETDVSKYKIKDIPLNSMVLVELVPEDEKKADEWYSDLKVGDVLTFRYLYRTQQTITHRIVAIEEKPDGGYIIELEGDNKNSDGETLKQTIDTSHDRSVAMNYVIGKVVGVSRVGGAVITGLKKPLGMLFMVIVPCLIIIALEVIRILNVINNEKRKKTAEEIKKQDDKIAELERQLAEMRKDADGK